MFKHILTSGLLLSVLSAESFDVFLQKAVTHSPYLKSQALGVDKATQVGETQTRYANPNVDLEYSLFSPTTGAKDNGFRASLSQPIRLWGVGSDKDNFAEANVNTAKATFSQKKAAFVRDLSLLYTLYAQQNMLNTLGKEELSIASDIYNISLARFNAGTISQGVMLQSKVGFEMIKIRNESLSLAAIKSYYELLKRAGITQDLELDTDYTFETASVTSSNINPDLLRINMQEKRALSQEAVFSNKIEWVSLFAEYESEPEQAISRFGLSVPIALFNSRSQEREIAKLQATQSKLLADNKTKALSMKQRQLSKESTTLIELEKHNKTILSTQLRLLKMFQEGYKISNTNLLQLQDVKNKVIETKERLIKVRTALNQNAIYTNYTQGSYNE